ncbi:integral membrane protein [Staphylococcus aureus]|uniref:Integral membrane protein n=1 Tax=Staphylococcus aureus TaxID=1280 RepID=A0A380DP33_STAAU|nr:integral membrane protein [Staphylococcus aureus]
MPDSITIIDENKVIDVVLIAGRILLESGAETYRVEDTMNRIAHSYGLHNTYSFVSSTAIIFSLNDRTSTRLIRVQERTTDLEKIALTNSLSRKISNKELTIDEAKSEFIHLQHASLQYSFLTNFFAAAIACGFSYLCLVVSHQIVGLQSLLVDPHFNIQLCTTLYTN